ncbi:CHAT domain-containing protein [Mycena polygramma]|nr:CHAT domain-containing protein [Mycena polygramma]
MSRILYIHNIRVRAPIDPHPDLPAGMKIFAQLIGDGIILKQTVPTDREDNQDAPTWKFRFDCEVPPHIPTFTIAVMRKIQGTRLLGSIEIGRGEALTFGEERKPFRLSLVKVNPDSPLLNLTVALSISTLTQEPLGLHGNNIQGLQVGFISPLAIAIDLQLLLDATAQVDPQDLWVMHERILLSPKNTLRSRFLKTLGDICIKRWKESHMMDVLNQAVLAYDDAVRDNDTDPTFLLDLGTALIYRVDHLDDAGDLDKSIRVLRDAVDFTPDDHPAKPHMLRSLGHALYVRFDQLGDIQDVNESVSMGNNAVELVPDGHPDKPYVLKAVAGFLRTRFERLGDLGDLNKSISMAADAVQQMADDNPDKPHMLSTLGQSLVRRFERFGNLDDLNQSVSHREDAVQLIPDGHMSKPAFLDDLGNSLLLRFERLGNMEDLDRSVLLRGDALHRTPDGHPWKLAILNNLGHCLCTRFEHTGDPDNIDKSVSMMREAVHLTPGGRPQRPSMLNSLGNSLRTRFENSGALDDINEFVKIQTEAVRLTPDDDPEKALYFKNLGNALGLRFERFGDLSDLERSLSFRENSVDFTPDNHPDKPSRLTNLGASYLRRFERLGHLADLNKAVSLGWDAVRLAPDDHPGKAAMWNNLGGFLSSRFSRLRKLDDLNMSVSIKQDAVRLMPDGHPYKPLLLSNLGSSLFQRFAEFGTLDDLNESVSATKDAVHLTPDGHPHKPLMMFCLAQSLLQCFEQSNDHATMKQAIKFYTLAATSLTGAAHVRFKAAAMWANLAKISEPSSVMAAYQTALDILPELAWLGLSISDRHRHLWEAGGVVRDAAATAIEYDQAERAVEWLEQGRSVIWTQFLNLRSPVDMLETSHPKLAENLLSLSAQLEVSGTRDGHLEIPSRPQESLQSIADRAHQNAHHRTELLQTIRELEGFSRFLLPKRLSELTKAAQHGPVAILNVGNDKCDALILIPGLDDGVVHIPLRQFTPKDAGSLAQSLSHLVGRGDRMMGKREGQPNPEDALEQSLAKIWVDIVKPVLDGLAINTPMEANFPRIWWCPTGPLAFLPIHAAGHYSKNDAFGSKLSDFMISSYIPSLTALIEGFRAPSKIQQELQLLAVAQPSATGQTYIPGTQEEITRIQEAAKGKLPVLRLDKNMATVESVKQGMKQSKWVHFACHGVQNKSHPTESALLLAGSSHLTLSDIIQLALPHADLAFLSACHTATGDKSLEEESVHLAAGMLLAGYRGVIATMWTITDNDAPQVARDVYEHLFRISPPDHTRAAEALHLAIQKLRQGSGSTKSFFHWVPFIHIGV